MKQTRGLNFKNVECQTTPDKSVTEPDMRDKAWQMQNNHWRKVILLRCHQKQRYVTVTFEDIRVSVPILNDICTLAPLIYRTV